MNLSLDPRTWFHAAKQLIQFGLTRRVASALLVASVAVTCVVVVIRTNDGKYDLFWADVDRWMTVVTLIVAIAVWFGEIKQEWEADLPRRLNVYFLHEGRPLIVCKNAFLPGEHDARNLAQQIAQQMCGIERQQLKFHAATIKLTKMKTVIDAQGAFIPFQAVFTLLERPQFAEGREPSGENCLCWVVDEKGVPVQGCDQPVKLPAESFA